MTRVNLLPRKRRTAPVSIPAVNPRREHEGRMALKARVAALALRP